MAYADQDKFGRDFETKIQQVADTYWSIGYAFVQKAHTRMIKINGRFIYGEKNGFDFYGSIMKGYATPMPVYFEAKSTADNCLAMLEPQQKGSGIKYHQLTTLEALQRRGNMAFILWEIRGKMIVKLSPYSLYLLYRKGERYIRLLQEDEGKLFTRVKTKQRIDYLNLLT